MIHPAFGDILPPEAGPAVDKLELRSLLDGTTGAAVPCMALRSDLNALGISTCRPFRREPSRGTGWILARGRFDPALRLRAAGAGVTVWQGTVGAVTSHRGEWSIEVGGEPTTRAVRARFIVDATGRVAAVARRLGARYCRLDKRVAWTARWASDAPVVAEDRTAVIERSRLGWWYAARLPSGDLHVAFHTAEPRTAHALLNAWHPALEKISTGRTVIDRIRRIAGDAAPDTVEIVGGGSSRLEPMFGRGWVAIGDAGAAFDPVSGQGIANALVSGFIAARASADHFSGRADALAAYAGAMRETHDRTEKLVAELYRVTEISEPASMVKRTSYLPNAGTIRSH